MLKCPWLYEKKKNKGTKRETGKKGELEVNWRTVEQFLVVFSWTIRVQIILWGAVFLFFTTFAKKFIIQITWNVILYHWHVSPAINCGKFLFLRFFFFFYPRHLPFSFDMLLMIENNKTLTAPLHLINILQFLELHFLRCWNAILINVNVRD